MGIIGVPYIGNSKITVTVYGAKNELVTIYKEYKTMKGQIEVRSLEMIDIVQLNEIGEGTIRLDKGIYYGEGNISNDFFTLNYFYNQITSNSKALHVRPKDFIYWYGVKSTNITASEGDGPVYYDTYFDWLFAGSWGSLDSGSALTTYGKDRYSGRNSIISKAFGASDACYLCVGQGTGKPSSDLRTELYHGATAFVKDIITINNATFHDSPPTFRINANAYGTRHIMVEAWYNGVLSPKQNYIT